MSFWSKAFRFTAMFMVLFAAVEILACDLLPNSDCSISHPQDKGQPQDSGDNCLCCCSHMVAVKPLVFEPQVFVTPTSPEESVAQPLFLPSQIEHPPQLS